MSAPPWAGPSLPSVPRTLGVPGKRSRPAALLREFRLLPHKPAGRQPYAAAKKRDFRISPEVPQNNPGNELLSRGRLPQYHRRRGPSLPCSVWLRVFLPRNSHRKKFYKKYCIEKRQNLRVLRAINNGQDSRLISTGKLNTSLCVHIRPIKVVVFNLPLVLNPSCDGPEREI